MMVVNLLARKTDDGVSDANIEKVLPSNVRRENESMDDYLWRMLQGGKLAGLHFRRNQMIEGYVAPFYCRLSSLVVEVDDERCKEGAPCKERERAFTRYGLRTLRIDDDVLLANPAAALQRIRRAAEAPASRAPRLARPMQIG